MANPFTAFRRIANTVRIGRTPWGGEDAAGLSPLVWTDILGTEAAAALPLSRAEALTIPAVSKARNLLVSTIAKFPLESLALEVRQSPAPWFTRTGEDCSAYNRMAMTIDDAIFYGYSLWRHTLGAKPADGTRAPILSSRRIPIEAWHIDEAGNLIEHTTTGHELIPTDEAMLIEWPFAGLLEVGQRTIRGARDTERAWVGRARNPIPMVELHQTDDSLEAEQVTPFVKAWSAARRSEDGAIGYTPQGLEIRVHGAIDANVMIESRNAVRTDVGSFVNVRASMIDGTAGVDSLTYTTSQGERNSFYEFDLPFWTDPLEARLSMDDVTARGTRIRFDKYSSDNPPLAPAAGPIVED